MPTRSIVAPQEPELPEVRALRMELAGMRSPGVRISPASPQDAKPSNAKIELLRAQIEAVEAGEDLSESPTPHLSPYAFTNLRLSPRNSSPILEPCQVRLDEDNSGWQRDFLSSPSRSQGKACSSRHAMRKQAHRIQVQEKVQQEIALQRELVPGPKRGDAYDEKATEAHIFDLKQEYIKLTTAGQEGWQARLLGKEHVLGDAVVEQMDGKIDHGISALQERLLENPHHGASFQALRTATKSAEQRMITRLPVGLLSTAVSKTGLKHGSPTSHAA